MVGKSMFLEFKKTCENTVANLTRDVFRNMGIINKQFTLTQSVLATLPEVLLGLVVAVPKSVVVSTRLIWYTSTHIVNFRSCFET